MLTDKPDSVHVVKVNLHDAKPPVWRRLELPSFTPLDLVHEILQVAFDWTGYHLHRFETVGGEYGDPLQDDWSDSGAGDESAVALGQVAAAEKAKVVYVYDFGDNWRHDIVVEKIQPAAPGVAYPCCTGGRGETPAEDSGGIRAFNEERAKDGVPDVGFNPADVTEALAHLAIVVTTNPARRPEHGESLKDLVNRAVAHEVGMPNAPREKAGRVSSPLIGRGATPTVLVKNEDIQAALDAEDAERYGS